jgi:quinoprotein glucose dehydrogenase
VDTIAIPGAQGGANWGTTAAHPTNGTVYVISINVPSIYKLTLEQPGRAGGVGAAGAGLAAIQQGRALYERRCESCHGANLAGVGTFPSLIGVATRVSPDALRAVITSGRLAMPPAGDLTTTEVNALVAFLTNPTPAPGGGRGRGGPLAPPDGSVVATGGAPGALVGGALGSGGMVGPPYPPGLDVPSVRYYTGYGLENNLMKPPYSTLTAYDLNTGTIKWQVPAGGDEPRAAAEGATNTGTVRSRAGLISTAPGLLLHAGGDGNLRVYDPDTGQLLGSTSLPGGSIGVPAMYQANGRQFLAVNATQPIGGRGAAPAAGFSRGAYVAFALPAR